MNKVTKFIGLLAVVIFAVGALIILTSGGPQKPQDQTPTPSDAPQSSSAQASSYTLSEVAKHSSDSSCWTAVNGSVYDVSPFIAQHPGGSEAILSLCGIDGSAAFDNQHGGDEKPAQELAGLKIGILKTN